MNRTQTAILDRCKRAGMPEAFDSLKYGSLAAAIDVLIGKLADRQRARDDAKAVQIGLSDLAKELYSNRKQKEL